MCKLIIVWEARHQNKYGGRARLFKPNLNSLHFPIWPVTRLFKIF